MRQRFLISFLIATTILVYSFGRLPLNGQGLEKVFAVCWLVFAIVVIFGNLYGLLHKRKQKMNSTVTVRENESKHRSYG
ncbi:hypothetical protein [Bacillus solitudinis]|uniref:hypothetical protein n=1 Tax=Bacillus solitudinis TaxID=2014074 RepID=UPI000C233D98|nr:hypothetical protein [Bacillus solitudinis]